MGFKKDAIVMFPVPEREKAVINSFRSEISRIPGIETASFCSHAPASPDFASVTVHFDSRTEPEDFDISVKAGDDQYISTFGLQLIAGQNLQSSDTVREFLLNETAVKKLGLTSPQDAIGKRIQIGLNNSDGVIVGVVKDFHNKSFHETIDPVCITTSNVWYFNSAIKITPASLSPTLAAIEGVWKKTFPHHVYEYEFLDEQIARFYEQDNIILRIIQVFAGIVIGRRGRGLNENFTVRRISYGEGVERIFPVNSPRVEKIEIERQGRVRRAKLTYLRKRIGKGAMAVKERDTRGETAAKSK